MLSLSTAALLAATAAVAQYNAPPTANSQPSATTAPAAGNANAPATTTSNAPSNPAVKTTEGNNPGAPAPGAKQLHRRSSKARIESRGYANVTELSKDANGFWKGKAMKDGKAVNITLDYQGNVTVN
jgi:putative membrane protein